MRNNDVFARSVSVALCAMMCMFARESMAQTYPYYTRLGGQQNIYQQGSVAEQPPVLQQKTYPSYEEKKMAEEKSEEQQKIIRSRQNVREKEMSILERKQTEYDPLNIRVGDFIASPIATVAGTYIDNVYLTENNTSGDYILSTQAGASIKSDFIHHQLEAQIMTSDGHYNDNESEDFRDYIASIGGRYDVSEEFRIPVGFRYTRDHTKRDSPEDADGINPTIYSTNVFFTGVDYIGYALDASFKTSLADILYEDNRNNTFATINNQDRNRTEWNNTLTVGMSSDNPIAPFLYAGAKSVNYDAAVDDFGVNKDSFGWSGGIGTKVSLSGVTKSSARIGVVQRDFDDVGLDDITAMEIGADVTWEPSTLMALTLAASRYVDESSLQSTAASVNSDVSLKATYEIEPNLFFYPEVGYLLRDYQSSNNRQIGRFTSGAAFQYKLNRNVWGALSFQNIMQSEDRDGSLSTDATSNAVTVSMKLQI